LAAKAMVDNIAINATARTFFIVFSFCLNYQARQDQ
jgi:hypothetical protein